MKKVVKKKNNTSKKLPTILGTSDAIEYVQTNPVTEAFIDNVCKRLLDYSRSVDALYIGCFIREMGIPHRTFYNWLNTWPQLAEAFEDAKINIGYGRMQGAAKRHFDKSIIMHGQFQFGDNWKKEDAYQAELRKNEEEYIGAFKVHMHAPEKVIDRDKYKPINGKEKP